jgi:mRNA interferase MazF
VSGDPGGQRAFAAWDIVRVEFPYADQTVSRKRPALVVASHEVDQRFSVLWVLMITSARHRMWPRDVAIADLAAAGVSRPCLVRTAKMATVDSRFATTLGRLPGQDRALVAQHLRSLLQDVLIA